MRHLDLFSGIGGFALGLRLAGGFETVQFCEIDPYCQKVLAKNFPGVPMHDDIRSFRPGHADIITGGFPCQPFSHAGKRAGTTDDRDLWPEMRRVIAAARPTWVIGENVAGFVNMELDRSISDLEAIGYACQAFVVPACATDAPHRRDRVWIVGHADRDSESAMPVDAEASGLCVVANPDDPGRLEQRRSQSERAEQPAAECGSRWLPEPRVGRVAHGIPRRVDRLRGLGNAVVPQLVAEIGRAIVHAERQALSTV